MAVLRERGGARRPAQFASCCACVAMMMRARANWLSSLSDFGVCLFFVTRRFTV